MTCRKWMEDQGTTMSVVAMAHIVGYDRAYVTRVYKSDFPKFKELYDEALPVWDNAEYKGKPRYERSKKETK